jgi:uncharacterized membrane protein HdeD (DUF308 family)
MDDGRQSTAESLSMVGKYWWLWLVAGIVWIIVGFVILQFEDSSIRAVGIIIGVMFLIAGLQYVVVGTQAEGWNWLWYIFGGFLIVGGLVAMFNPERTFVAIANIIGFIFLMIGIIWIIEAFATKTYNDLWWLTLITGILMIALAFWLGNQFFFDKAATLLVFAGVWALMRGIIDIIGAFQVKKMGKIATDLGDQMAVG